MFPAAFFIIAALTLACCSSDECDGNKNALPLAGFYDSSSPLEAVTLDSLDIIGVGAPGDQEIIEKGSPVSQVYLPFRLDSDTTVIAIRYMQEHLSQFNVTDTITFRYERIPFFVSAACGAMYNFRITDIECTGLLIDSVTCPVGTITNANMENLRIYFKIAPDEDEELP